MPSLVEILPDEFSGDGYLRVHYEANSTSAGPTNILWIWFRVYFGVVAATIGHYLSAANRPNFLYHIQANFGD